ncbi:hypothetical protein [Nitrobacter vulgaris]|uniref:Uncharacterized protein n=1 Tax=Nitrobacter vulgaris TaxID=29421 RepID=A0A1V4HTY6_NITVU|nr:hypothetical protein [Nitrobacter vulgaris]OPH81315.1 hypothetical protein B2M20_18365 [Nitrobacter vulgaris]
MSVNRRFVLKGAALSSIGLTVDGFIPALAANSGAPIGTATTEPTMLALVNEGGAESIFLYGAMAAGKAPLRVQKVGRDLGFMLDFERRLRHGLPMRVIGLLDDASATLIVDMARSGGARVQWLGQHTAEDGFTRHQVLSTDMSEGCAQQLSRQLHDCGAGFKLIEERQNGPVAPRQLTGLSRGASQSVQWASSIGYLLASIGTRTTLAAPLAPTANTPITGSFVSFSIDV